MKDRLRFIQYQFTVTVSIEMSYITDKKKRPFLEMPQISRWFHLHCWNINNLNLSAFLALEYTFELCFIPKKLISFDLILLVSIFR